MTQHNVTLIFQSTSDSTNPGIGLYRASCDCGWETGEFHVRAEAEMRARNHLDRTSRTFSDDLLRDLHDLDELRGFPPSSPMDDLYAMIPGTWRSADGTVWRIEKGDLPERAPGHAPVMTPTHAQKCVDHLRRRHVYGPFTMNQQQEFDAAPIILAFRRRIAEADSIEWRDARWRDWMYEKKHGVRPG